MNLGHCYVKALSTVGAVNWKTHLQTAEKTSPPLPYYTTLPHHADPELRPNIVVAIRPSGQVMDCNGRTSLLQSLLCRSKDL